MRRYIPYYEAIPLSAAKSYSKGWDKSRVADWFDGQYRIVIPLQEPTDMVPEKTELQQKIEDVIGKDFEIVDYKKNIAKEKKNNRPIKITKALIKQQYGFRNINRPSYH